MEFFKKRTNFRFMPLRQRWYAISGVLILASLADARDPRPQPRHRLHRRRGARAELPAGGGPRQGARRAGGGWPRGRDGAELRHVARRAGAPAAQEGEDTAAVGQGVLEAVQSYEPGVQLRRTEVVGAQIGEELAEQGALAALFAFLLILAYVAMRFQWKLAVGSIVAALHDPILVLGFFAATADDLRPRRRWRRSSRSSATR